MRKTLAVILAFVFCLALLPGAVLAEPAIEEPVIEEPSADGVAVTAANFPDENFRNYISENIDTNHDGVLSDAECEAVTEIEAWQMGIASVEGIGFFPNLEDLDLYGNELTSIDLSGNSALERLTLVDNRLRSIDLSESSGLCELWISGNMLTSIDLSGCPDLTRMSVSVNPLTSLDVSMLEGLDSLWCEACRLTSLKLNKWITHLSCSYNPLGTLDVSGCPELVKLACVGCELTNLHMLNPELVVLDCSENPMKLLSIGGCPLLVSNYETGLTYRVGDRISWYTLTDDIENAPGFLSTDDDYLFCGALMTVSDGTQVSTSSSAPLPTPAPTPAPTAKPDDPPVPTVAPLKFFDYSSGYITGTYYASYPAGKTVTIYLNGTQIAEAPATSDPHLYYPVGPGEYLIEVYENGEPAYSQTIIVPGSPTPAPLPQADVQISPDGKTASASGDFGSLYARIALVLDNGGVSGLYVTQGTINADGTIVVPAFMVPGLSVVGVNITLVPTISDIQSRTPRAAATAFVRF